MALDITKLSTKTLDQDIATYTRLAVAGMLTAEMQEFLRQLKAARARKTD